MKTIRGFSLFKAIALAVGLAGSMPATAHAQLNPTGSFTLARDTHWGSSVLTPGKYKFTVDLTGFPARITVRNSTNVPVALILCMATTVKPTSAESELRLESSGSEVYVSSLYLKDVGMQFQTRAPKMKPAGITEAAEMQPPASAQGK
jgi:hypothetical protein